MECGFNVLGSNKPFSVASLVAVWMSGAAFQLRRGRERHLSLPSVDAFVAALPIPLRSHR